MSQKFEKLKTLLKELFQLDQPDLDFGLYRIMHAKSAEITQFLERDLLPQVREEFAQYKTADKSDLEAQLAKVIAGLQAAEVDPDTSPKVRELRDKIASDSVDLAGLESEVYDHLYGFFRRYYSEGDFLSKRVYKPGVYAIPYEGEEVKLHWANADQYYIKTSEYLRDYAFRLHPEDEQEPMRVHFRLIDAAEGEHGNVKAAEGKDRIFILASKDFATIETGEQGPELILRFEYRPATLTDWPDSARDSKKKPPTQKEMTELAESRIMAIGGELANWNKELGKPHEMADGETANYSRLHAHLKRYVARNTFDYFIHKDLGEFLRRELDFYIKNEVMHLDDIEGQQVPRVEQYLSKIRVIRRIATKIVSFLAQLEDFQRKLWLKKKFVVDKQYLVSIREIPDSLLGEIVECDAQWAEWESLFHFSESSLFDKSLKLKTLEFLKANPSLMIDTRHHKVDFTARLTDAIGDLEAKTDGLLVHSENYQALQLLQARYRENVRCIYIDPPYNTGGDGFVYKDSYQHSTWLAMMRDRINIGTLLLQPRSGVFHVSIGEDEQSALRELLFRAPDLRKHSATVVWKARVKPVNVGDAKYRPQNEIEYVHIFETSASGMPFNALQTGSVRTYPHEANGRKYRLATILKSNRGANRRDTMRFEIDGYTPPEDQRWQGGEEFVRQLQLEHKLEFRDGTPFRRYFEDEEGAEHDPYYCFMESEWTGTSEIGKTVLNDVVGNQHGIDTIKPTRLIQTLLVACTAANDIALDYFACSGTTGHSVIALNREDGARRRFVLVEMASYFDTVLVPRIKKVAFTPEWRAGKPTRSATAEEAERGPRVIKLIRLESYEDTLNNLQLRRSQPQQIMLEAAQNKEASRLKEQYMLGYMLNVEAEGSQSLLNVRAFNDPTSYKLKVKRPGSDETREVNVDLLETFNWLIGLTVQHIAAPQKFSAKFERDSEGRLKMKGRLKQDDQGSYWFRTVTGTTPDGRKTLVIWRKRPGGESPEGVEQDNLVLDEWFTKQGYSSKDSEFGLIYVNGTNNLENLRTPEDLWKVRLIEEDFHRLMFAAEGV